MERMEVFKADGQEFEVCDAYARDRIENLSGGGGAVPDNVVTIDKTGAATGEINPILTALYPVGSIYMSVAYFDPATVFGGVWEQISGRFLLAADDTYKAGSTGGEATHTLTEDEMPRHTHSLQLQYGSNTTEISALNWTGNVTSWQSYNEATEWVGGSQAHNNMPPYLAVYVWKRVS